MKHPEAAGHECGGGLIFHSAIRIPLSNFSKYPLHYLLAQASQCLVCPLSICDNASVGSCSGGPASLCFLGSPVVLELSEGRKYVLMSQVLSNTSVKVFFGTKTSLRPPNLFFLGGGGGYVPLAPPTLPPMTS